jgi:glycosyltransferase involved in cell wall biosynthesis
MAKLTVLFATLNGALTLPRMLDTLKRLEPPVGGWRIIAVDNGSTDDSLRMLREIAAELPMTIVSEPRRGKNIALNAGLSLAEGDVLVLTDDDVILPTDWLVKIQKIVTERADFDVFGGAIYPVWEDVPPTWVLRCVPKGWLAWTDFPEGPVDADSIWGPNMAVRRTVIQRHRFAENIGPDGSGVYAMGSETEFTMRLQESGHRCWHFHTPSVGHIIRPYQLTPEWLLQRAYNLGRGQRRKFGIGKRDVAASLIGYPTYLRPSLIKAARNVAVSHLFGNLDDRFKALSQLRYLQGDFAERSALIKTRRSQAVRGLTGGKREDAV